MAERFKGLPKERNRQRIGSFGETVTLQVTNIRNSLVDQIRARENGTASQAPDAPEAPKSPNGKVTLS